MLKAISSIILLVLISHSAWSRSCEQLHRSDHIRSAVENGPLLSAQEIVQIYGIKPSAAAAFISRYEKTVLNDWNWMYLNPEISVTGKSLVAIKYHFLTSNLSDVERQKLINQRRNVPGKIEFQRLLFNDVL